MNNIDLDDLKRAVALHAEDFARWLFPAGRRQGSRWHVGDLSGAPGQSLAVELTGEFSTHFRDWGNGERGDCIAATMAVQDIDFGNAVRLLADRYGGRTLPLPTPPKPRPEKARHLELPDIQPGSREDLSRLSTGRNLSLESLRLASGRGLLWFHESKEGRAWLITDARRCNAQARRLDGQPWAWNGKKAWTLSGSCASWPIGLPESADFPGIALCEGSPDFLAAFHHADASGVADRVAPVCIVGAGLAILPECLPAFAGKRVRIFVHNDDGGMKAARRWASQLHGIASNVDGFTFDTLTRTDGAPVKDLCDLASIDVDSWEAHRDAVESCMGFATEGRAA